MAANFRGKIGLFTFIHRSRVPKGLEYHNADGRINSGNDLATSCENLVNFGPVTPEFTTVVRVHRTPRRSALELV